MRQSQDPSKKRHLSLKALKVFESCARHGSFTSAADELFITQSAVSKQIRKLEDGIGFSLFIRDAKSNRLSPAGQILAAHLIDLFADLETLIDRIAGGSVDAPLIVSCEPTVCLKLLIPSLPQILSEAMVEVRVLSGGGAIDFRRDHVDIAIRRNDFPIDDRLHIQTLGSEQVGPVISPSLDFCKGSKPESFVRIHANTRPDAWLNWQEQANHNSFKKDLYYEHHFLALEAAESGQGAALMSLHMVAQSLEQGRLVAPVGFIKDGSKYVCLSASPIELDDRKIRFINWFKAKLSENTNICGGLFSSEI
ncbi:LysR family transcriptional regulator [Ahrensia kielensis]|uniref:LysR family transcriptional regulator n=1 Tax=Ahrensia kielensis TaxID=76980 RepID=UPI000376CDAB|nr:LysR family transcriptional regulator [Ahrensia kielensis]